MAVAGAGEIKRAALWHLRDKPLVVQRLANTCEVSDS